MKLRSGINTDGLCRVCDRFYGNPKWGNQCSTCQTTVVLDRPKWYDPNFRKALNEWTENKLQFSRQNNVVQILKNIVSVQLLKNCIHELNKFSKSYNQRIYISAQEGEELLRHTGENVVEKSHIICPLVIDWWNMKQYNYERFELCYYGRYGEPEYHVNAIPPPPPIQMS